MLDVLESVRRVIYRHVKTNTPLAARAVFGDTVLEVDSTLRFVEGDRIALHNGDDVEYFDIEEVIDTTHLRTATPVRSTDPWELAEVPYIEKCINGLFVEGVYIGEPDVIVKFPAITIMGQSRTSNCMTLGTTEGTYRLQIGVYVEESSLEDGYYFLLKITDTVQRALKKNIFPLVGDIETTTVIADLAPEDLFIRVADSSIFAVNNKVLLEDRFKAEELRICEIIDATTIKVFPTVNNAYSAGSDTKIIRLSRFIHNSWPEDIQFGYIHKGSMLKAATISWFAKEVEVQTRGGWSDPQLS